jgi:hypothetical protein
VIVVLTPNEQFLQLNRHKQATFDEMSAFFLNKHALFHFHKPMQSVPITTDVSSNFDQGKVYNISDLRKVGGFLRVTVG